MVKILPLDEFKKNASTKKLNSKFNFMYKFILIKIFWHTVKCVGHRLIRLNCVTLASYINLIKVGPHIVR